MSRRTVLGLFESKGGVRIDEARLSARLAEKVEKLNTMLLVLDHLRNEVGQLNKRRKQYRLILLSSLFFATLGLFLGLNGVLTGNLPLFEAAVSLAAATVLLGVDYYLFLHERRVQSTYLRKSTQVEGLAVDLDVSLDGVYDEVLAELYPSRRPASFGRRVVGAKQSARRVEKEP